MPIVVEKCNLQSLYTIQPVKRLCQLIFLQSILDGSANSRQVRIIARRATVGFFVQHLMGGPALLKPPPSQALILVAQGYQVTEK
jgi:hypothetical protein